MTTMILATVWTTLIAIGFVAVSFILIGVVLLQKNRGSGLSGAFGGVGGHSAFGTKTGDVLTWFTVGVTGVFLLLAIFGNYAYDMSPPPKPTPVVTPPGPTPEAPASTPPAPSPTTVTVPGGTGTTPSGTTPPAPTPTNKPVESTTNPS